MVVNSDCLVYMKTMPDNSVDAIVTDPPYGLSFMGKKWDYDVPSQEIWEECLRVLKPGGYLLAFAGTRTQHRMAVRIEDAGFEIRDMIAWVYGCLSEDTEVLTQMGYKQFHKLTQYDKIAVYDIKKDIYQWERPQRWSVYSVHKDTAYRIKSDYTDQIVSRNHRCLVERNGKLVFKRAENLSEVECMPTLSDDFYSLQEPNGSLLFTKLLWKSKVLAQTVFGKRIGQEVSEQGYEDGKESSVERWSNLFQKARQLSSDKIYQMSTRIFRDGEKRRICDGTQTNNGSIVKQTTTKSRMCSSYQPRSTGQSTRKPDVILFKQGTQDIRRSDATITKIKYSGIIFCPTVSTGAFVARRNGQVFITGNSGFPKSLNIGKAVDKIQGNERVVVGKDKSGSTSKAFNLTTEQEAQGTGVLAGEYDLTKGTSEWEGWGTALKPALEPITVARKPLEGNVAQNCLKWGVGGINIDGCRVGTEETITNHSRSSDSAISKGKYGDSSKQETHQTNGQTLGRFPANLIHDGSDEVVGLFPNCKSTPFNAKKPNNPETSWKMTSQEYAPSGGFADSGSAARFFYCAKASKSERNRGCEDMEDVNWWELNEGGGKELWKGQEDYRQGKKYQNHPSKNFHPTVKPIALMEYLVKLVSKEGHTVLDPFMGSGSTGIACKKLGREFIGIELDADYCKIAEARINVVKKEPEQLTI